MLIYESQGHMLNLKIRNYMCMTECTTFQKMSTQVGTPQFISPEVYEGNYGRSCDYWSLGALVYGMVTGYMPVDGETAEEIEEKTKKWDFNPKSKELKGCSIDCKQFLGYLLSRDLNERRTATTLLMHPFIQNHQKVEIDEIQMKSNILNMKSVQDFKLDKKVTDFIAQQVKTSKLADELKQQFIELDKDGNGMLSAQEITQVAASYGVKISKQEMQEVFKKMDVDGDGSISYNEFLAHAIDKQYLDNENKIEKQLMGYQLTRRQRVTILSKAIKNSVISKNDELLSLVIDQDMKKLNDSSYRKTLR